MATIFQYGIETIAMFLATLIVGLVCLGIYGIYSAVKWAEENF